MRKRSEGGGMSSGRDGMSGRDDDGDASATDGDERWVVERWVIEREASAERYAVARSRSELQTFVRLMRSAGVAVRVHDVH
jgi:hypothetical protein